jgi:hypothetical protein
MAAFRFCIALVLTATGFAWLGSSLGWARAGRQLAPEECSILRPGGLKEPGVKNAKGECCSAFWADDCIPPYPGQDGMTFRGPNKR